ncbi:alpha/beta hydrolase [Pelagibacterium halotolerans]|uniref:Esterase n=1 Tax=Pelagibacterium halotolerans (strain DSM 22347 / JCM 15775 / CGMCC 1.7692 / B2) TaxID=1082931 RepID=G4REC9_PELHB|nr:alpha/beta hydrolase [Pelagibacterium halotolerans]AEQ52874.1 esterase/lipase/thioesterase family protein [Pelagibacterium halotolerans B2]AEV42214.1 esterase [Pelagibacterium halotolerans B2]QJR17449.1 alpha/beta hydrolase [Pelagibacterium halotolerans]SEA74387.1 Acetyl esterase/lipase [Pelagibacterium halotolerans]
MVGAVSGFFGIANAFSPVGIFNALVPKDGGVAIERNVAFGAHPRQKLDIYRPAGDETGLPVIYFSYGGGWESGDKAEYGFVGRALAARGYVTVIADYRLVPEVVFPDFVADNGLAVQWVADTIGNYGGDPGRMVLMGHSAGAYNVMMLALDPQFGVDMSNIRAVVGLSGPYDFYPFDVSQSRNAFGNFPRPEQTQPVNLVSGEMPPVFLGHGDKDETVFLRNSVALAETMTNAGVDVSLRIYEGGNHADTLGSLAMPLRWRYPVLDDVLAFIEANPTSV